MEESINEGALEISKNNSDVEIIENKTCLVETNTEIVVADRRRKRTINFIGNLLGNLIGNIPIVGPLAGAIFTTLWDAIFTEDDSRPGMPPQPRFLTYDEFHQAMAEFRVEIEDMINNRIDDLILRNINHNFNMLKLACDRYHEAITWYEESHGQGRHRATINPNDLPNYLKRPLPQSTINEFQSISVDRIRSEIVQRHARALTEMDRCMTYFTTVGASVAQQTIVAGYAIQTCSFFIMIQRDVFFKGRDWGFIQQQINAVPAGIGAMINRCFFFFARNALPSTSPTAISNITTPDLYKVYSTFAYLDLSRFSPNRGIKLLDINHQHNVLTIEPRYSSNNFIIVANHYFARKEFIFGTLPAKDTVMEGVFNCDNFGSRNFEFVVSRPSNPISRVICRTSNSAVGLSGQIIMIVDGVRRMHETFECRDMHHYARNNAQYIQATVDLQTPRHQFLFRIENLPSGNHCNHTVFEFL